MFLKLVQSNYFDKIREQATERIRRNRDKYNKHKKIIIDFCKNNNSVISNIYSILKISEDLNFPIKIYAPNTHQFALNIAKIINKKGAKYVKMLIFERDIEYIIMLKDIRLCEIYNIGKCRDTFVIDIVQYLEIDGVKYFDYQIEIIHVYRSLYNPDNFDEWGNFLLQEKMLFDNIHQSVKGGRKWKQYKKQYKKQNKQYKKYIDIKSILLKLKKYIISDLLPVVSKFTLIGVWAYYIASGKNFNNINEKVQIISNEADINEDMVSLRSLFEEITKHQIYCKLQQIRIPMDFRTRKFTVYVQIPLHNKVVERPIIDIFNSASFELIPRIKIHNLFVGNVFVLLRFLFIDIWILHLLHKINIIDDKIKKIKINYFITIVTKLRNNKIFIDTAFNTQYYGFFKNPIVTKKIKGLSKSNYPFYPEKKET